MDSKIEMSESVWVTWTELRELTWKKKVVFFGCSPDWAEKTKQQTNIDLIGFLDNSVSLQGTRLNDVMVFEPEEVLNQEDRPYVVVTASSYESIYPQLLYYGLIPREHFCISPALLNLKRITDIHNHKATLLISSPDHKLYTDLDADKSVGGGLYKYTIRDLKCEKVLNGTFHQIAEAEDSYYIAEEIKGVVKVNKNFEIIETFGFEQGSYCHGVAYCPKRKIVCVSRAGLDKVTCYDADSKKEIFSIILSNKKDKFGKSQHWINDLCIENGYLYICMFSISGAYLQGIYDGGILQVDLDDIQKKDILVNDAWMPHTVRIFDSQICYLDSMRGYFKKGTNNIIGEFNGFMRGIAFDGKYFYVGQSETRYFERLHGVRKNIAMNAGFFLFEESTYASKFFSIPQLRQVHDCCWIEDS
jgi:hypothetical protein